MLACVPYPYLMLELYNLVNHHQSSCFGMFDTFHVAKDVHSVALVQPTVDTVAVRCSSWEGFAISRLQKEDIGAGVLCTKVNVAQNA